MNPIRRIHQAASFVLATVVTLGVMSGLDQLASPDSAAASQFVVAASAPSV